jgi:two-component system CheB/CheR fusion protein
VRLPFDILLHSLAESHGMDTIGIVLSGTGADGSLGVKAVKDKGGLVIAQDPEEAVYADMPRNAMKTGSVSLVLPVALIPQAILKYKHGAALANPAGAASTRSDAENVLSEIIALLHARTAHDFKPYKHGTLRRRIERRMAMTRIKTLDSYLDALRLDDTEIDLLAKDLLINVTSFFRDARPFAFLARDVIPGVVRDHPPNQSIRIWVVGCSTGEEAYSLIMLFREEIARQKRDIKLQVFASDLDADAVATAREGFYSDAIQADVSPERLRRFFAKEDRGYRVLPDLRASVVFTVQDVLADPPFSKLDMISCRNLLIYLGPEAQAKVISLFHFALNNGGFLFLGDAEVAGDVRGQFEIVSKSERVYRHIGRARPGELRFLMRNLDSVRVPALASKNMPPARPSIVAELCRRLVIENYAPAALIATREGELLYSVGPTDKYLRLAPGLPVPNLVSMARNHVRAKLRSAMASACKANNRVEISGTATHARGAEPGFKVVVQPVQSEGRDLLFVSFLDEAGVTSNGRRRPKSKESSEVADLKDELLEAKTELRDAIRNLDLSAEDQKAVNEEALSVNEEFQASNEELLTSKEELQSLNEELTALNAQLQETLERQRTTSNDLQNVLYSTDVATVFLDSKFNIRFFTPATKALFNVIPSDVGRPLNDLHALATDSTLFADAQAVLKTRTPIERETQTAAGVWFSRRILPYLTADRIVEGVVITFTDITERKRFAEALASAKQQADRANTAKSRFLAAASHDLRQPLQTLTLVQSLLAKTVESDKAKSYLARQDAALRAMSEMLNTLLEINQIEAGAIEANFVDFPVADLLERLKGEFNYHAAARSLALRVVSSSLTIRSDPSLLEQMIRNLISNALKFTKSGKILLGCRRRQGRLSIEVWDTGIGIPAKDVDAIFEEYHQLGNEARETGKGVGLGLSIVKRLGDLLGHPVRVRSRPDKGSAFAIDVELAQIDQKRQGAPLEVQPGDAATTPVLSGHEILIVEDDLEMRELLELLLKEAGHRTATAADGVIALELIEQGSVKPDILLSDYNLPRGMNGVTVATRVREKLGRSIPVIILTGDITTDSMQNISIQNCVRLKKPIKFEDLTQVIHEFLAAPQSPSTALGAPPSVAAAIQATGETIAPKSPISGTVPALGADTIFIVDDDPDVREALGAVLREDGHAIMTFATCEEFLEAFSPGQGALLLIDGYLPGMSGLALLQRLHAEGGRLPAIMITGNSDVHMAVEAMKAGASDFIEKPIGHAELSASVTRTLEQSRDSGKRAASRADAIAHLTGLTSQQRKVMEFVLAGHPSKNIAADLGISQRTVENHRAQIMKRTGAKSLPALARLAMAAGMADGIKPVATR